MNIQNFVFDGINLSVFVSLVVYVWKKYIGPMLRTNVNDEEQEVQNLQTKKQSLQGAQQRLQMSIQQQELFFRQMEKNFSVWQDSVKHNAAVEQQERKVVYEKLQQQRAMQQKNFNIFCLQKQQFPEVLRETQELLIAQFSDKALLEKYQNQIITGLQQKGHDD